jgi:transcriptional regulator with XRE-family HTH domain
MSNFMASIIDYKKDIKMSVGTRLKEERQRLGLNQAQLAQLANIARASQINYETDKRSPDNNYWQTISNAGIDVQYVITGKRSSFSTHQFEALVIDQLSNSAKLMLKEVQKTMLLIEQLKSNNNGNAV